ncbi:MAG: elongation factor G [Candidatus Velthaea sp.]
MSDISRLRNVAFVGPHHAGKTTLVEALLAHCGAIARRGSVQNGTTITDCEPEAIEHVQSTCTSFAHTACGDVDITIIDTPGFIDFFEETKLGLLAADAAVIVVDAEPSRVAQTAAIVEYLEVRRMPHLFFVNKLDRPGADFAATLAALRAAYGPHVVAEHLPIGSGESLRGYVDLARTAAYVYDADGKEHPADVPAHMASDISESRQVLLEALADFDDHLLEQLLEGIEPSRDEIDRDLCEECAHDQIVAVIAGRANTGSGAAALVDAIARLLPSPQTQPRRDIDGREIVPRADGPIVAQVCKTIVHPQAGKLSVARVFTGTLSAQSALVDASRDGAPVKPGLLYRLFGKKQEGVESAGPGSIVAIARLEGVGTGDTLTSPGANTIMPVVPASEPVFAVAIKPRDKLDESKLSAMLARLLDEDPALRVVRAEFTNELHLVGNGEMHVATATERLSRKYNLALETHAPTVPYRETIRQSTDVHARYKHQTGGHGQFADVKLRIEPRERGHGVTFSEAIVGGVVPKQFFSAVERGVREALMHGPAGNFPIVDVHVTLTDGAYHAVDSSEAAFKTAAGMAVREGIAKCGPVVLEPLVRVDVVVPSDFVSPAIAQLKAKRAQILGFDASERGGYDVVHALVPQAELARYITELRTATAGFGTYSWRHERFEVAPERVAAIR